MTNVASSFIATTLRQLILSVTVLGELLSGQTRVALLRALMPVTRALKSLGQALPGHFLTVSQALPGHFLTVHSQLALYHVHRAQHVPRGLHVLHVVYSATYQSHVSACYKPLLGKPPFVLVADKVTLNTR